MKYHIIKLSICIILLLCLIIIKNGNAEITSYNIGTFIKQITNDTTTTTTSQITTTPTFKYSINILKINNITNEHNNNIIENISIWSTSFSNEESFISIGNGEFRTNEYSGNFNITDYPDLKSKGQTLTKVEKTITKCNEGITITPCLSTLTLSGNLLSNPTDGESAIATYTVMFQQAIGQYSSSFSNDVLENQDQYVNMQINVNLLSSSSKTSTNNNNNNSIIMPSPNRLYIAYDCDPLENFYGMGEQYTVHGMKGRTVPIFSTEQGIGRGLQPISRLIDLTSPSHVASGNWHTSYTAIPHYISSSLKSVYVNDTRYLTFNFGNTNKNKIEIMAITNITESSSSTTTTDVSNGIIITNNPFQLDVNILYGKDVKSLVQTHTSYVGRMSTLPEWVNKGGAVVGWEGGTRQVQSLLAKLQEFNVSIAAFWLQDWSGVRSDFFGKRLWWNWELDEMWYPNWSELAANLTKENIHLTTYMNPYLANTVTKKKKHFRRDLWKEAAELGYLVLNDQNTPYIQSSASKSFSFSTIDLTNPNAREWTKKVIRCNMLGDQAGCTGNATAIDGKIKGWMSDFGEYLPFDAVLHSGEPAATVHNKFPALWAQTCREAIKDANLDGQVTFWSRSAAATSPTQSTLFWAGDQLTTWDFYDGLQSALRGMLSGGISGMSLSHSDIGGYTEVDILNIVRVLRTEELLQRWVEMEAFSGAMFRTHPGLKPSKSAQIDSSNFTLKHFAFFSHVHSIYGDYRLHLMEEDMKLTGAPLVRYMFYEFPNDETCWKLENQFMLGSEFLIAPVFEKDVKVVHVYLPEGTWVHVWSNQTYVQKNGGYINQNAPIKEPAVFRRVQQQDMMEEESEIMKIARETHEKLIDLYKIF